MEEREVTYRQVVLLINGSDGPLDLAAWADVITGPGAERAFHSAVHIAHPSAVARALLNLARELCKCRQAVRLADSGPVVGDADIAERESGPWLMERGGAGFAGLEAQIRREMSREKREGK